MLANSGTFTLVVPANQNAQGAIPWEVEMNIEEQKELLKQQLEDGEVAASAPCDAMYEAWSEEDVAELNRALEEALFN